MKMNPFYSVIGSLTIFVLISLISPIQTLQQCYEHTCSGTSCLTADVTTNPNSINKCERLIDKGCFVLTVSYGFNTTTTGCVDQVVECAPGSCSSLTLSTELMCCNSDLCNDGQDGQDVQDELESSSQLSAPPLMTTTIVISSILLISDGTLFELV